MALSITVTVQDLLTNRPYTKAYTRVQADNFADGIILKTSVTPALETSQAIQVANPEIIYLSNRHAGDSTSTLEIGRLTGVYEHTLYPGEATLWLLNGQPTTITLFVRGTVADMEWEYYAWTRRA